MQICITYVKRAEETSSTHVGKYVVNPGNRVVYVFDNFVECYIVFCA